jgi:hypothetical protein
MLRRKCCFPRQAPRQAILFYKIFFGAEEEIGMRIARASMGLILTLCCVCLHADESDPQKVTLVGTVHRAMAIGAESTGWMVQVDSETIIDGKPISSIEVSDTRKPKQLEGFENKRVKIAGKVLYRHGVETGVQSYVEIMTIKADPGPDKP